MPMAQLETSWPKEELFSQAIAIVSDDAQWMVQAQSDQSLVLRREKNIAFWKLLVFGTLLVFTLGFALLLFPFLLIGFSNQQIAITIRSSEDKTAATINFTSGAKKAVNTLLTMAPRPV